MSFGTTVPVYPENHSACHWSPHPTPGPGGEGLKQLEHLKAGEGFGLIYVFKRSFWQLLGGQGVYEVVQGRDYGSLGWSGVDRIQRCPRGLSGLSTPPNYSFGH